MSSCVATSPSPFHPSAINTRPLSSPYSLGQQEEDSFDQASFPFLDGHGMDYYIASTPESSANLHEDHNINMARPTLPIPHYPSHSHLGQGGKQSERPTEDVSMGPEDEPLTALSNAPNSNIDIPDAYTMPPPHEIAPYNSMYGYTAMAIHEPPSHQHQSHFHPYRYDGYRSQGYTYSPPDPTSPPLSISPPGSAHGHHPALSQSNSPPQAVSPAILSPASVIGSMSDGSPSSGVWAYNLPHVAGSVGSLPYGTPLTSITTLPNLSGSPPGPPGGMLRMVSGLPYHASPIGMTPKDSGKVPRPKSGKRQSTSRAVTKKEVEKEEEESEGEEELDLDDDQIPPRGKSIFTLEEIRGPNLTEEVRKARIKSEQRRRDELREGFKRLREALPNSNQRPSKSSILDRAVAHIQQLTAANHWYQNHLDQANHELATLRANNAELIRTLAAQTRSNQGSASSPGSSGRGGH